MNGTGKFAPRRWPWPAALAAIVARFAGTRALRYPLASAVALGFDMGSFLTLLALGFDAVAAAIAGYGAGIAVHWLISSRFVFAPDTVMQGRARWSQKALFAGSALVGLAITVAIVALGGLASLDPRAAKLVAVAASFAATWVLRSQYVFRRGIAGAGR